MEKVEKMKRRRRDVERILDICNKLRELQEIDTKDRIESMNPIV